MPDRPAVPSSFNDADGVPEWRLDDLHAGVLLDFTRLFRHAAGFSLYLMQYNDGAYRDRIIPYLNRHASAPTTLSLDAHEDVASVERRLAQSAADHDLIHLVGLSEWLTGAARPAKLRGFNYHRELLAEQAHTAIALWLLEDDLRAFALEAPDLWAWRKGVFDFSRAPTELVEPEQRPIDLESADLDASRERLAELRRYLAEHPEETQSHAALLREEGLILDRLGHPDDALTVFREALTICRRCELRRDQAIVQGYIARIYVDKGDVDRAIHLYEESLQVAESLGDIDGMAHTLWSLARIDLQQINRQSALEKLERSYRIYLQLERLDGICYVGRDLGRLLRDSGHVEEGVTILKRSEEGFRRLGREDIADQVRELL